MTCLAVTEFLKLRHRVARCVITGTIAGVLGGPVTAGGVVGTTTPVQFKRLALGRLHERSATQGPARMRVRLIDSAGLSDEVRAAVAREVETIWSPTGVEVDARRPRLDEWTPGEDPPPLYVVLRDPTPFPDTAARRVGKGHPAGVAQSSRESAGCVHQDPTYPCTAALHGPIGLAWTPFTGGVPGSTVFVSVANVRQLLSAFSYMGRRYDRCTTRLMEVLLARALGRVIAHEIGHVLYGPMHTRSGLMKPILDDIDLLDEKPPSLADAAQRGFTASRPSAKNLP